MKTRVTTGIGLLFIAGLLAVPAPVAAQATGTFKVGWEPSVGGVMHEGGAGVALGLPALVSEKNWSDTHDAGLRLEGSLGFKTSANTEIFGAFEYGTAAAKQLQVGTVAGLRLTAEFEDYEYWGVGGGARYLFGSGGARPYITGQAGLRRVSAINTTLEVADAGVVLPNLAFYGETTVPTFGVGLGVLFGTGGLKFGVEAAVHYAGGLDDQPFLAGTGLENLNDAGDRWSLPVSLVLKF